MNVYLNNRPFFAELHHLGTYQQLMIMKKILQVTMLTELVLGVMILLAMGMITCLVTKMGLMVKQKEEVKLNMEQSVR